jgi:hypothetical protein
MWHQKNHKKKGISLLVAMGGSLLVLGIALLTLISIRKSLDQSLGIERSTKFFFAAESAIESGFYHHNARGVGLNFEGENELSQEIKLLEDSVSARWTLDGRKPILFGLLREDQTVQIPLYWDNSGNPTENKNTDGKIDNFNFELTFLLESGDLDAYDLNADGFEDDADIAYFESIYGTVEIGDDFDFGSAEKQILIDWSMARRNNNGTIQTFSPTFDNTTQNCGTPTNAGGLICENELQSGGNSITFNSPTIGGRTLPIGSEGSEEGDMLDNFVGCVGSDNCDRYSLTFRPLLKFESEDKTEKIPGIPYVLETTDTIPQSSYTLRAEVSEGEYAQTIELSVPEKTTIGAFNYVIFD